MAELVNLRRVKKQRERAAAATQAAENRARHGKTRAEREAERMRQDAATRILDGAALHGDREPSE